MTDEREMDEGSVHIIDDTAIGAAHELRTMRRG